MGTDNAWRNDCKPCGRTVGAPPVDVYCTLVPVTTIKINAITVPAGRGDELLHRFAGGRVPSTGPDGFEGFDCSSPPTNSGSGW